MPFWPTKNEDGLDKGPGTLTPIINLEAPWFASTSCLEQCANHHLRTAVLREFCVLDYAEGWPHPHACVLGAPLGVASLLG